MDWHGREDTDQIGGYRNPSRKTTGAWVKAAGGREETGNIKETELKGRSDVPAEREQKHLGWLWFLACTNPQTEASFTKSGKMARTPGQGIRSAHSLSARGLESISWEAATAEKNKAEMQQKLRWRWNAVSCPHPDASKAKRKKAKTRTLGPTLKGWTDKENATKEVHREQVRRLKESRGHLEEPFGEVGNGTNEKSKKTARTATRFLLRWAALGSLTTGRLETRILRAPHYTSRVFTHCAACGGEGGAVNGWSIAKQRVHRMRKTEMPGGWDMALGMARWKRKPKRVGGDGLTQKSEVDAAETSDRPESRPQGHKGASTRMIRGCR